MEVRPSTPDAEIDLHELFFKLRRRWLWFVLALLLAGGAAWLYLKVKSPVYEMQSTLLIGDQSTGSKKTQELLQLLDNKEKGVKLEDEVGLLTSAGVIRQTLAQLPFAVSYFQVPDTWLNQPANLLVREQLAADVPFRVQPVAGTPQLTGVPIYVDRLSDGRLRVHATVKKGQLRQLDTGDLLREVMEAQFDQTVRAGDTLRTPLLSAVISLDSAQQQTAATNGHYFFQLNDLRSLTEEYQARLKVAPTDHESRILLLTLRGTVPAKEALFLNKLMETYVQDDLAQKNQTGRKAVAFLDEEIGKLASSRQQSAQALSSYRSSNGLVDAGTQSNVGIQQQSELATLRARTATTQKYYRDMLGYMQANRGAREVAAPSSAGIDDPAVTGLIQQLTQLNGERASVMASSTNLENPLTRGIDDQISTTKESLIKTLSSLVRNSATSLRDLDQQLADVNSRIAQLPEQQRKLAALNTSNDFNEKNYNFLVEKRNEAAIALATNNSDKKVIDPAALVGIGPAAPKPALVALLALLAGLALPTGLILLLGKANRRVQSREDLARVTAIPVLGAVPHVAAKDKATMLRDQRGQVAEAFRSIRVNMQYLSAGIDKRVIGVTSSVPGEGKTFSAINLAAELAQGNRRVILLECDLRRPTLGSYFDLDVVQPVGLSSYLTEASTLDESRLKSSIPNLDIMCSGPIPENPTKLLESPRFDELLVRLKEEYDYVLIDTPPVGYVSEFFVLLRHFDVNIYVVRQNYTDRSMVSQINELHLEKKVKQIYIIINDVNFARTYEYRYKGKKYSYD